MSAVSCKSKKNELFMIAISACNLTLIYHINIKKPVYTIKQVFNA